MNLPNKLSIARICCIPLVVVLLYLSAPAYRIAAGVIFVLGCFTDFLDGHIARKHQLITDFGKFIDPVADKLLVLSALIMLIHRGLMDAWPVILILCRELAVDGLRMIAVGKGKVIAADKLGKWKTTFQMILICVLIFLNTPVYSTWYTISLLVIVVGLTLFSGFNYFRKNLTVFQEEKA